MVVCKFNHKSAASRQRGPLRRPTAAPHKPAEEYLLPDKFDDMSQVDSDDEWAGEGTAAEHLSPAWTQETARLAAMSRARTGGEGEIVVSFPAYLRANSKGTGLAMPSPTTLSFFDVTLGVPAGPP